MRTLRFCLLVTVVAALVGVPATVVAQDEAPSSPHLAWGSAAIPPASGTVSHPRAVSASPDGFVAVGSGSWRATDSSPQTCIGEAWTSPDGITWTGVGSESGLHLGRATEEGPCPELVDVAFGPAGYVAIGRVTRARTEAEPKGEPKTAIWRSTDGLAWERVSTGDAFGPRSWVSAIAGTTDGYLIVGAKRLPKRANAAAWTSTDGVTWVAAPDDPALAAGGHVDLGGGFEGSGGMTSVASGPDGFLAAGGICRKAAEDRAGGGEYLASAGSVRVAEVSGRGTGCVPAVWRSADGQTWQRQVLRGSPPLVVTDSVMGPDSVAVLGTKAILGEMGPAGPTLTVLEGATTTPVDLEKQQGVQILWALGVGSDGFLALGVPLPSDGVPGSYGMWTSADGLTWQPVADPPTLPENANVLTGADIATDPERLVVVGSAAETIEGGAEVGFALVGPTSVVP